MDLADLALVVAVAFAVAWTATGWYLRYALRGDILDVPNPRSSHRRPTPTGGGLGIIAGTLLALAVVWRFADIGADWLLAMWLSLMLGLLGFVDDRVQLGVGLRLVCQACAALAVVTFSMMQHNEATGGSSLGLVLLALGAVVYLVWMTNLFNFMDGIDGLASTQAIFIAAGGAWLTSRAGASPGRYCCSSGSRLRSPVSCITTGRLRGYSWVIPAACSWAFCLRRARCRARREASWRCRSG